MGLDLGNHGAYMGTLSDRQKILLSMHEFYRKEARHQRDMMWETVKWTTLILLGMYGFCAKYLSDFVLFGDNVDGYIALSFIMMTLAPCAICIRLLSSFYESNLKYITMYAKVEDELCFDERVKRQKDRHIFVSDKWITWQGFREKRQIIKTSDEFVKTRHKYSSSRLHGYLTYAMFIFVGIDIIGIFYIIYSLYVK